MEIYQVTMTDFFVGHATATSTPQPIMAAGYSKIYKGVTVRCLTGTVYIGPHGVTAASGFELPAGKELLIPIENPSKVYVVGDGTYSWLAV